MQKHVNIVITGRVQGVGFRWSAKKRADRLHVAGFVTNRPDGTLYIEAEGTAADVEAFVAWCKKGPLWAKVQALDVSEGQIKDFDDFIIQ